MKWIRKIQVEVFLAVLYCITILVVNPTGQFPLNDDWAYSKSVWSLYQHHQLKMNEWPAMTLIAQIYWGTLFCKIVGLSFLSLRICTLFTGLAALITLYKILKEISKNQWLNVFIVLLVFFNPLFFSLSYTYMTDVHFFSFMLLALYFFIKYMQRKKIVFIVWATVFSIIASLIRQPGILIPLSFTLFTLLRGIDLKSKILASLSFLFTLCSLLTFYHQLQYLVENAANIAGTGDLVNNIKSFTAHQLLTRLSNTALYLGLFLLPMLILYTNNMKHLIVKTNKKTLIIALCIFVSLLLMGGVHYPVGNVLFNLGLGPKILKDTYWNINITPSLNEEVWLALIKTFSVIGAAGLLLAFVPKKPYKPGEFFREEQSSIDANYFLSILAVGYTALIVINSSYFDRYVLPLLGMLCILFVSLKVVFSRKQKYMASSLLFVMALFSVSATHDYLSWNRARWQAAHYLVNELKISEKEIDGGFEFNAWYNTASFNPICKGKKSWWFVANDEYVISFGAIDGYKKYQSFSYSRFLPFENDSIYVLKKETNFTFTKHQLRASE